jgi:hypothetical protein
MTTIISLEVEKPMRVPDKALHTLLADNDETVGKTRIILSRYPKNCRYELKLTNSPDVQSGFVVACED